MKRTSAPCHAGGARTTAGSATEKPCQNVGERPRRHEPPTGDRPHHPRRLREALGPVPRAERRGARSASSGRDRAGAHELEPAGHRDLRRAGAGGGRVGAAPLPRRPDRRDALAAGEAGVHRPALRPQAAGVRRDLLQLGGLPGARPDLLPERVHLLAAGGGHRVHRGRRPDLALAGTRPPGTSSPPSPPSPGASGCRCPSRTCGATCASCCSPSGQHLPGQRERQLNFQVQVLSSLFFRDMGAYVVGRLVNGNQQTPVRRLPPPLGVGRGLSVDALLLRARATWRRSSASPAPTSSSTWTCRPSS